MPLLTEFMTPLGGGYVGICGTEEHYKHADMISGHEGVGFAEDVGESVSDLNVGDVGWG